MQEKRSGTTSVHYVEGIPQLGPLLVFQIKVFWEKKFHEYKPVQHIDRNTSSIQRKKSEGKSQEIQTNKISKFNKQTEEYTKKKKKKRRRKGKKNKENQPSYTERKVLAVTVVMVLIPEATVEILKSCIPVRIKLHK